MTRFLFLPILLALTTFDLPAMRVDHDLVVLSLPVYEPFEFDGIKIDRVSAPVEVDLLEDLSDEHTAEADIVLRDRQDVLLGC